MPFDITPVATGVTITGITVEKCDLEKDNFRFYYEHNKNTVDGETEVESKSVNFTKDELIAALAAQPEINTFAKFGALISSLGEQLIRNKVE